MVRPLNLIVAGVSGLALLGAGVALDRNVLIPLQQARQAQAETITKPDVSGRVIHQLSGFYNYPEAEYYIREYQILTGEGKQVWGILPTLVSRNGKYAPSLLDGNKQFDPGKLPRDDVLKVGHDVRLKFGGESKIAGDGWIDPTDDYGEKILNPQTNPIMVITRHQITEPAADANNGFYAARAGMVVDRSFHRHIGETENVVLEEYTLLDSTGRTWHFAKKHPFPSLESIAKQQSVARVESNQPESKLRWQFNPPTGEQKFIEHPKSELEEWNGGHYVNVTPALQGNSADFNFGVRVAGRWFYNLSPNQTNRTVQVTREEFDALKSSGKPIEQVILYKWTEGALVVYSSINNGMNPKLSLLKNTRTPRPQPLLDLGSMVSITPEQFILDGKRYYHRGEDGFGTRTEKLVSGIGEYQKIEYRQNDRAPTIVIRYLLPLIQSRMVMQAPTAR